MQGFRTLLTTALLALNLIAGSASAETTEIRITGVATVPGAIVLELAGPSSAACGVYTPPPPAPVCFAIVVCSPGDTGSTVAAALASYINDFCSADGFTASVAGHQLAVTHALPFGCSLATTGGCGGPGTASLPLSGGCTVNNVCNGFLCDGNLAPMSGLVFTTAGFSSVPTLGEWGLLAMLLSMLTLGTAALWIQQRRTPPGTLRRDGESFLSPANPTEQTGNRSRTAPCGARD